MEESGQIWNVVLFLECQSYRINRNEKEKERFFSDVRSYIYVQFKTTFILLTL